MPKRPKQTKIQSGVLEQLVGESCTPLRSGGLQRRLVQCGLKSTNLRAVGLKGQYGYPAGLKCQLGMFWAFTRAVVVADAPYSWV